VQHRRAQHLVSRGEFRQDGRDRQRVRDVRVTAHPGLALMPGRRHVVGPPDELNVGIWPGDPEDLAEPAQGIVLAGGRLRLDLRLAVHSAAPSGPGCAALRLERRFLRRAEISARAIRACSAPSLVSW